MGKIYKRNCNYCGNYYEGEGKYYCKNLCKNRDRAENSVEWRRKNRAHWNRILANPTEKMLRRIENLRSNPPMKGKKHSLETRKKISVKAKINFRGKNNPNYKGNKAITLLESRIRNSIKYKEWRTKGFKRDNYTCQKCKNRSKKGGHLDIEFHHINEFAKIIKENNIINFEQAMDCKDLWELENGVTYCTICHNKLHNL